MQAGLDTLKKRLYQLIISRLDGDKINRKEYRDEIISLVQNCIGGFILFGGIRQEIREFIDELQSISEIPLFIASDLERGAGQQIKGLTNLPCSMAIAAALDRTKKEDVSMLGDIVRVVAEESKDAGINMPLIPVLDVNQNPDNPIICTRAFSDSPETVSWLGLQFIKILEREGLISCAKHFPGHGDTSVDSHISLPVISKSLKALHDIDLMPFKMAIKNNVSALMIGHLSIPSIDSAPSSISKKIVTELLRKELGFEGLILTDALNMNALKNELNLPARCLNAGVSILLHPDNADHTVRNLNMALQSRQIDEKTIDSAIYYILKAKEKFSGIKRNAFDLGAHDILSKEIILKSITLLKNKAVVLPIKDFKDYSLIFAGEKSFFESSVLSGNFKNACHITDAKAKEYLPEKAIFALFSSVSAWRGSSGIGDSEKQSIRELMQSAKKSIIISFGSPYILSHFIHADTLIAAYETTDYHQRAVLTLLKGEVNFKGHLPVRLYEF